MESVKRGLLNFCKGFGIWFLLLFFNTRGGEADVNVFKIVLDIIFAIILVGNYRPGKYIALLTAALTVVVTVLSLSVALEIFLLIGITILGGVLLKKVPEDVWTDHVKGDKYYNCGADEIRHDFWKSRNFLNPFETYSYSPDGGINICKGIIRRSYSTIPTTTTKARIHQKIWQRLLGFCDISFQNNYTGQQFGEDRLQNIRFRSAKELIQMIH